MIASFPFYFVFLLVSIILVMDDYYKIFIPGEIFEVILPSLILVSIITSILINLIHHLINLRDITRLSYATHGIKYNLMNKILFFIPYLSIIAKQKLLRNHLEQFHENEELPRDPIFLFFILVNFLGIGIIGLLDIIQGSNIDDYLGDFRGIIFFLLTLLLNPVPLRYYEFKWQNIMNLHIKKHLDALAVINT